jgi:predicted CxxxxCH...CXXCH cytochrome family protein
LLVLVIAACAEPRELSQACGSDCGARVHAADIVATHPQVLREHGWDFSLCQGCHGEDFAGGKSGVSCVRCHAKGPTDCTTCHGEAGREVTTGAHQVHLGKQLDCAECHVKPARWDAPGHILGSPPVNVTFGALAATATPGRQGPPTWDGATCSNIYCHGDASSGGGTVTRPRWDDPTPAGCSTRCHGQPPPSHARTDCATCHPTGAPHIDGVVQVGRTSGCDGCHGSAQNPAPPTDLSGNTFTTAIGVGAHQVHLSGGGLRGPVACATCHVVPQTITAPGHLHAGPANVDASLGWDRSTQTCGTAWCHRSSTPVWTTQGTAACGTCHGVPPADANHDAGMTLATCVTCHAATMDATGNIVITNGSSHHIDGVIDAN